MVSKEYKHEIINLAAVAELVDALDLKSSCRDTVRVRFPPAAQISIEI